MKAIVQHRYGPPSEVLALEEIDRPAIADAEVLVRVRAASVHPDVWHVVRGFPHLLRLMGGGLRRPTQPVPGTDLAGVVEAVGPSVTRFKPGDEVFGETLTGMQWTNGGAYAEYAIAPEDNLAPKPGGVSFEQAATVPTAGFIALMNLRDLGKVQAGQHVLVNGAGGGVGMLALLLAKAYGAEVTAVDTTAKLELLRSLGADHVIDFTREDFTRGTVRYDLLFDVPGNHPLSACRRVLKPEGLYVLIAHDHYGRVGRRWLGSVPRMFGLMGRSLVLKQLPRMNFTMPTRKDVMAVLSGYLAEGKLTPVIDRTFPLGEAAAAIDYLAEGQAVGRIVLTI